MLIGDAFVGHQSVDHEAQRLLAKDDGDIAKYVPEAKAINNTQESIEHEQRWSIMRATHTPIGKSQLRVFAVTWLAYFSVYLTRKPISVTKSTLQDQLAFSSSTLGLFDVGYLSAYALGQFVNGWLGDRLGARIILSVGLAGSAVSCIAFSFMEDKWILGALWTANGIFQSCAWPGCIKAITPWFATRDRGFMMGWWSTCYAIGGVVGTISATAFLDLYGWEKAFLFPALVVLLSAAITWAFLVNHPSDIGLLSPYDEELRLAAKSSRSIQSPQHHITDVSETVTLHQALMLPGVLELSLTYFVVKLIVSALFFWLPYYLDEEVGYSSTTAGYVSAMLDVGGSLGSIFAGYASDRWAGGRRVIVAIPCFVMAAASMGLYLAVGETGVVMNGAVLGFVGVFIFGPDSLLAGAAAQDIGGRASSTVAGLINGIGSIGAILQGPVTDQMSDTYGWESLFYLLISLCGVCCVLLSRLLVRDIQLIREAMMVLPSSP